MKIRIARKSLSPRNGARRTLKTERAMLICLLAYRPSRRGRYDEEDPIGPIFRNRPHIRRHNMALRIELAAIRDLTGRIWTLPRPARHCDISLAMHQAGLTGFLEDGETTFGVLNTRDQGFLSSDGRFVRRAEAWQIAVRAGQCRPEEMYHKRDGGHLFSEDIW